MNLEERYLQYEMEAYRLQVEPANEPLRIDITGVGEQGAGGEAPTGQPPQMAAPQMGIPDGDQVLPPVEVIAEPMPMTDQAVATAPTRFVSEGGPSMTAYEPTVREQLSQFLQAGFEAVGMDRFKARQRAQTLIGGQSSNLPLEMGLADIVPFLGTAMQTEEAGRMLEDAGTLAEQGQYGDAAMQAGLGVLGLVPGVAGTVKAARPLVKPTTRVIQDMARQIATTPPVGGIQLSAPAKVFSVEGMAPDVLPVAQKVVLDGVASNMSPTKMIQAIEAQTGKKVPIKQQKQIKDYVAEVQPKGQIYSDQAFKDLIAQPLPFEPSTQKFQAAFDDAMNWLNSLDAAGLKAASAMADQRLAPILGVDTKGNAKRLLTTNGKLLKTETGVEGGVPIELPDGRNIESAGLAISPAYKAGKFSTCPNSASCAQECLGKTSGGYFAYGGGADLDAMKGTRLRSFRMTQAMFREPEAFAIKLHNEILSLKKQAAKGGNALAIRLNVLSDIDPRVHKSLIEAHPDVFFYDYTKMKYRPVAPNHHYTYSSTGVSQKAGQNGLSVDVDNEHTNWVQMKDRLDNGMNVAMAFSSKKALPTSVFDEATGKTYQVIDGDAYDFRPMDAQPAGSPGVIVGLKNKAMTRKEEMAAQDSKGFFVQYDPQFKKDGKKLARDANGELIPLNTQVIISPQKREAIMLQSGGAKSDFETGESITARAQK